MATLTMATEFAASSFSASLIDDWADEIETLSGGTHTIDVRHAGELVGAFEVYDAVQSGLVDLGFFTPSLSIFPEFEALMTGLDLELSGDFSRALFETLPTQTFTDQGLTLLGASYYDPVGFVGVEINTVPDDLTGSKVVVRGMPDTVLTDAGASVQRIPNVELYTAVQTGVIDRVFAPISTLTGLALTEISKTQTLFPAGKSPAMLFSLLTANSDALDAAPADLRDLILATTGADFSEDLGEAYLLDHQAQRAAFALEATDLDLVIGTKFAAWQTLTEATVADLLDSDSDLARLRASLIDLATSVPGIFEMGDNDPDTLDGAAGDDTLLGEGGADILAGLGGEDSIEGGADNDNISGGPGEDTLKGDGGSDTITGNSGADTMFGGSEGDEMLGGSGGDLMYGQTGDDTMRGELDGDRMFGGQGKDLMQGGQGDDTMHGEAGSDRMFGQEGADLMFGGWFSDFMYGGANNDRLEGEGGLDRLFGGGGNDVLLGGAQDDVLFGAGQDDFLGGGTGNDILRGEGGRDVLSGDAGNDTLEGGWFSDRFVFRDGFGLDVITDFDPNNLNERIDLRNVSAITDFTDLVTNHLFQVASDVEIRDLLGNVITVENVTLASLSDGNDFLV